MPPVARGARLRRVRRRAPADRRADRGDRRVGEAGHAAGRPGEDAEAADVPRRLAARHAGSRCWRCPAAFELPASGPDIYRNFVIPTRPDRGQVGARGRVPAERAQGRAPRALRLRCQRRRREAGRQGRPARVRRHGRRRRSARGRAARRGRSADGPSARRRAFLPEGVALPLPKGSDIVLQMHFHLTGKPETEQSTDRHLLRRQGARAAAASHPRCRRSSASARASTFRRARRASRSRIR